MWPPVVVPVPIVGCMWSSEIGDVMMYFPVVVVFGYSVGVCCGWCNIAPCILEDTYSAMEPSIAVVWFCRRRMWFWVIIM